MPIVFAGISDPIGNGFVESFSRPGGNITGFTLFEAAVGGKWLGLLKEIAPSIKQVSMLFNPETANAGASGGIYVQSIEAAAQVKSIELIASPVHDPADIDDVFAGIAKSPDGGLIVMPNAFTFANWERIVAQAARYQIPTVYPLVLFVKSWWPVVLWGRQSGHLPARGVLRRSHPQGREASQPSGARADQIRIGD